MEVTGSHGAFCADGDSTSDSYYRQGDLIRSLDYLGSLAFSSSETSLIYTAEANAPTTNDEDPYRRFRFTPQFGEGLTGKKRPTMFIFRWSTDKAQAHKLLALSVPSSSALFGQAIFSPDSYKIYATGYEYTSDGRQLGIKGCYNRPSGIWEITPSKPRAGDVQSNDISCTARKLTPSHLSCRSPRVFSYEGVDTLFWLSCPSGGAHVSTSLLYSLDITGNLPSASTVVNIGAPLVDAVFGPLEDEFPGLYPDYNLPAVPFVHPHTETFSGPCIVTHSLWGSRSTVLLVSTAKGEVKDLTPEDGDLSSWTVLTTDGDSRILCARSTPVSPPQLMLGEFDDTGVSWRVIDKPSLSSDGKFSFIC
jgi:acylaminoacyl-peptidase